MPLFGTSVSPPYIATSKPAFQSHLGILRVHPLFHGSRSRRFAFGNEKRLASPWKVSIEVPRKVNFNVGHHNMHGIILIKAVATLETKYLVHDEGGQDDDRNLQSALDLEPQVVQPPGVDSTEMDERERLRRMRISKANKGNVPWNKGRKHSAETLRRIRERTKIAMQDPKVKMKLVNLGHAQSEETRIKIGVGVRMGWQRRREKLMVQETCYFEWQNLIAEASRRGCAGQDELQWDSYMIIDEELQKEWLESIEQRKSMPRAKGSKRAPKSSEQRRKISEAISAKWADPGYRERVCSALAKYHGTPGGVVRKPRRRPSGEASVRRSVNKKVGEANGAEGEPKNQVKFKTKRKSVPSYKDPLANSKLEMIKKIRAQRASMETKKREAIERAKLLIAEAEKAAKTLEVAATRSPLAQASLMETRRLIAEATRSLRDIEMDQVASQESKNDSYSSSKLNGFINHFEKQIDTENGHTPLDKREVNGSHVLSNEDFHFSKFTPQDLMNVRETLSPVSSRNTSFDCYKSFSLQPENCKEQLNPRDQLEKNGVMESQRMPPYNGVETQAGDSQASSSTLTTKKKWVSGRLVEVA
ncbi:PREDICTED: uncharacterized protein LOC104609242 [Nelumbo nucifera]|uniref:Nuclease associated modular domain-containing protein n=2 Tax=Nelumbo nucifera TaxID=4432 RepID=A0A823A1N3_NELNU|nr:PREDICTED: uncharacterized protein LOC104609242 [Nelumbo nucifera]DAD49209.1 TPA_asm: hypothetical protein HUJ06_019146 [Nelumbo nucifera]